MTVVSESSFEAATVSSVASRAGKSRVTFYNYFQDTHALLLDCTSGWINALLESFRSWDLDRLETEFPAIITSIDQYLMAHRAFFLSVLTDSSLPAFQAHFRRTIRTHITNVLGLIERSNRLRTNVDFSTTSSFLAAAVFESVLDFLQAGQEASIARHSKDLAALILSVLVSPVH